MTATNLLTVTPDFSVDEALELLVAHRVSGLPVVDDSSVVVGVVSDYDLLHLDGILADQARALLLTFTVTVTRFGAAVYRAAQPAQSGWTVPKQNQAFAPEKLLRF